MGPLRIAALVALGLFLAGPLAPAAHAAVACTTKHVNVSIQSDLDVPTGAVCQLTRVNVVGNIVVQPGGSLIVAGSSRVRGAVAGDGPTLFQIVGSSIDGGMGVLNARSVILVANTISGNVIIIGTSANYQFRFNKISGQALVLNNFAPTRSISNNTLGSTLACAGNAPPPIGGGNVAAGGKSGQCAGL